MAILWKCFIIRISKRRLDNNLENDQKFFCFCWKASFGNMIACETQNGNLRVFNIPVLTLLEQLEENGIAKIARKGKIKNTYDLTTISSYKMIWQQYLDKTMFLSVLIFVVCYFFKVTFISRCYQSVSTLLSWP